MDFYSLNEEDAKYYLKRKGLLNILEEGDGSEIPPKWDDLARLYFLVRNRKPFQILEFGSGFSTIVMAKALKQFYIEYLSYNRGKNRKLIDEQPKLTSVESSEKWMKNTQKKVDRAGLGELVNIVCSTVTIKEYQGQVCHFYEKLPDIVPDFVYLDGPDPLTVKGSINGLTFQNPERTVMAADILLYETTITPGFFYDN